MHLFPILIVAVVMAADAGLRVAPADGAPSLARASLVAWGPIIAAAALLAVYLGRCRRRLLGGMGLRALVRADRAGRVYRWVLLGSHVLAVTVFGSLDALRDALGDPIFLDELIALLPPLAGLFIGWWIQYPIERHVREAVMLRRLEEGGVVRMPEGRASWVWLQARLHLLLTLVPVLLILVLAEVVNVAAGALPPGAAQAWTVDLATMAAAAIVFVSAPLVARWVLGLRALPAGPLRDDLLDVCVRHRVRVRDIYVWDTHDTMINAAVMGIFAPFRIVLLTDALLTTMSRDQTTAVMAHEIGHVRRHHIPWLIVVLLAILSAVALAVRGPLEAIHHWVDPARHAEWQTALDTFAQFGGLLVALPVFGWISRRFERQADTFAVQHLSGMGGPISDPSRVTIDAVASMAGALLAISRLNMIDPERPSWRHGSIAWRLGYLRSIVGAPVHALDIDRTMRRIKWIALLVLAGSIAAQVGIDRLI